VAIGVDAEKPALPADEVLAREGLAPARTGRLLLIACGALAREILDLKAANGWTHIDLQCLPANLHLARSDNPGCRGGSPGAAGRLRIRLRCLCRLRHRGAAAQEMPRTGRRDGRGPALLFVLRRQCRFCRAGGDGSVFVVYADYRLLPDGFVLPMPVRQFDAFVWRPMGLDRHPELRDMLFGNYTKLVYQAQTEDPALDARAQDCARRLGLAYERRFTGYGDLATTLARVAR
jgi:hypothetical protein